SDHALAFISAGRANFLELGRDAGVESFIHKQRSKSIKPCLEEPQIFWLVDHLQAAHAFSLIINCRYRFGSHVHMRLSKDSARNRQPDQFEIGVMMLPRGLIAASRNNSTFHRS